MSKKRKRKLKKGRILLISIIFIFIISIPIYLLIPKNYGYKKEVIKVFKDTNVYEKLKEKKLYSKVLEDAVLENVFNEDYFDEYLEITYIEEETSSDEIHNLLKRGYGADEINTFYEKIPNSIDVITTNDYNENSFSLSVASRDEHSNIIEL